MSLGSVCALMPHQEHLLFTRLLAVNADLITSALSDHICIEDATGTWNYLTTDGLEKTRIL